MLWLKFKNFLLLLCLFSLIFPAEIHALGENIDPSKMVIINDEINKLHLELKENPENVKVLEKLILKYDERTGIFLKGKDQEAILMIDNFSERILELDPENYTGLFFRANSLYKEKKWNKARKCILSALKHKTEDKGQLLLAKLEFIFTNFSESFKLASTLVISRDKTIVEDARVILQKSKKYMNDIKSLENRILKDPEEPKYQIDLANIYLSRDLRKRRENVLHTVDSIEKMLKKFPDFIDGHLFLATVHLKYTKKYKVAEKITRKIIKIAKRDSNRKKAAKLLNQILMKKINR